MMGQDGVVTFDKFGIVKSLQQDNVSAADREDQ